MESDGVWQQALLEWVAASSGQRLEALREKEMMRWVLSERVTGVAPSAFLRMMDGGEPGLRARCFDALCVGETYFYRHPEQFEFALAQLWPAITRSAQSPFRIWSAGCASGEEAYSLAALFNEQVSPTGWICEVLGTDLSQRQLNLAAEARYGAFSVRQTGPMLRPVLVAANPEGGRFQVLPAIRNLCRFLAHNLLDSAPVPADSQHLIFCRNVLTYFSQEAAAQVVQNLKSALHPGGLLVFGPMDLLRSPEGLERCGGPDLQIFRKVHVQASNKIPLAPQRTFHSLERRMATPVRESPAVDADPQQISAHLKALEAIERGELSQAEFLLYQLSSSHPNYLPAKLERGLLLRRLGRNKVAREVTQRLRNELAKFSRDEVLAGPQALPVEYYLRSAEALISELSMGHGA